VITEERPGEPVEDEDPEAETRERAGYLVEEGWGLTDHEKDEVADAADTEEDLSAEEEAVRVEEEAPGGVDGPDSYVEKDEP
jgi:hypothetical protein